MYQTQYQTESYKGVVLYSMNSFQIMILKYNQSSLVNEILKSF